MPQRLTAGCEYWGPQVAIRFVRDTNAAVTELVSDGANRALEIYSQVHMARPQLCIGSCHACAAGNLWSILMLRNSLRAGIFAS